MLKTCLINPLFTEPASGGRERYFVRSGSRWPSSYLKPVGRPGRYLPFPFFLAYAAALLEEHGFPVSVLDAVAANARQDELIAYVRDRRPDLVFYETTTPTIARDLSLAPILKAETGARIVLAGPHATTFAREILEAHPAVDCILLYEYEVTLCELVSRLAKQEDLDGVPGLAWRRGPEIVCQPDYRPIEPLDRLPLPARAHFPVSGRPDLNRYWDGFCQHRPAVQMHASRGCPFRCDFCLWVQVMYRDGRYRTFSPSRVVDEMLEVVERYGAREVYFDDDDFTVSREHVLGICREILGRGLRLPWSCMGDAVAPDESLLDAMAEAGCVGMKFGLESANPGILKRLGKPLDLERVAGIARGCRRRRIKTHATVSLGLWNETRQSASETLSFVKALDVDSVQFSIATPFPGTRYHREMLEAGRLAGTDWERYDGARFAAAAVPGIAPAELQLLCAQAPRQWLAAKLRNPGWLFRQARYGLRVLRGQGLAGVADRIRRAWEILGR